MAMTLRIDDELEHALNELATKEGLSRQEVVRRAVLERYARAGHQMRVAEATEEMLDRWRDVLDLLSTT
jgi:predicted transcriptional regulator